MIISGHLLLNDSAADSIGRLRVEPGHLRIDGERISEVVIGAIAESADFGGSDCLISPGFIDAHLHLPQFDMIGAHGIPLLRWLNEVAFPAEIRWQDVDYAKSMTHRVIDQCYAHGTTAVCGYATVHHDAAAAALQIAADRRMRGLIGQVLMDREAPDELLRPASQQIEQTAELLNRFPTSDRMSAAVTPRFAISCTSDLLTAAGKLAAEHDAAIQTHLAETIAECKLVTELFGGVSYVDAYRDAGLLNQRSLMGHAIHLSDHECQTLANSGAKVVHCPTANSFLRSGTMNRAEWIRSGISLALGSDIGAGYERSMVRVGRAAIEAASSLGENYPTASEAWWQFTHGNARALGWPDADRFVEGGAADLLVIKPDIPWRDGRVDPLSTLMFAWDDRWIQSTIVAGSVVYQR